MKKILSLVILLMPFYIESQFSVKNIYIGFENGIKKDFTSFSSNENGYFLNAQHDWLGHRFLIGNYYYSGSIALALKNKLNLEFAIFSHDVVSYDIVYIPELKIGSSANASSPYIKYTFGLGYDLKIKNRFYLIPFLQLSYIKTDDFLNEVNGGGGSYSNDYTYHTESTSFTNNHFLIGLRSLFQWKFNELLNLNLGLSYNHGLKKSSKIEHTLIFNNSPENEFKGQSISKLSHCTLSLGLQYNLFRNEN